MKNYRVHEKPSCFRKSIKFAIPCFIFIYAFVFLFYFIPFKHNAPENVKKGQEIISSENDILQKPKGLRVTNVKNITTAQEQEKIKLGISSTNGVVVLGMHRSGTSMLTGLLVKSGLYVGEPKDLIQPAFDNEKGFYEMYEFVVQNDKLLEKQNTDWSDPLGFANYDSAQGLQHILRSQIEFKLGNRSIKRLKKAHPWILKDPRLCGTIRTWLPLLDTIPAVVFMYRHPVQVAKSLKSRQGLGLKRWFQLWTVYNKMAVLQSQDMCRIIASSSGVLRDPLAEVNRIISGLKRCGVAVPRFIAENDISEFIDPKLQHQKSGKNDTNEHECPPQKKWIPEPDQPEKQAEIDAYNEAMRIYCALESGEAFSSSFKWNNNSY